MYLAIFTRPDRITMVLPSLDSVRVERIFKNMRSFQLYSNVGLF
jgi:hypothetical protein